MPRGRSSVPTQLPKGFSSWTDLYTKWNDFLHTTPRTVHPSRAKTFAEKHGVPEWLIGTVPYIFRTAQRNDAVGEYAREMIKKIETDRIGVPKANNEIRAFAQQNPMFREQKVQLQALEETRRRLQELATLTDTIRNFSTEIPKEKLEEYFSSISIQVRRIQQLKNRIALAIKEREEE